MGVHAPLLGGLNGFINSTVGFIDLGEFHAPVMGGLNVFEVRIVGCIDLGGFMPH
jgi:hypothetical protein